eukprot:6011580-Alexandrium_andersonii.AAC.1
MRESGEQVPLEPQSLPDAVPEHLKRGMRERPRALRGSSEWARRFPDRGSKRLTRRSPRSCTNRA